MRRIGWLAVSALVIGCGGGGVGDDGGDDEPGGPDASWDETCPAVVGEIVEVPPGFVTDGAYLYYATLTEIVRVPAGGGAAEPLADLPDTPDSGLAIGDDHLFLVAGGRALRVGLAGGTPDDLGETPGQVVALASDGGAFYVASIGDDSIELRRAATPGGDATLLATVTTEGVTALASDGAHLYWLSGQPGVVRRVPVGGGATEVFADSMTDVVALITGHDLVLAGGELLWTATYQSFPDGALFAIPTAGGDRRTLTAHGATTGVRVHEDNAYVVLTGASESRIAAVPLSGGARTIVACVPDRVFDLEVSSAGVHVSVDGVVHRFPLDPDE